MNGCSILNGSWTLTPVLPPALKTQGLRMKKGNPHFWSILDKKSLKSTRVLHVHCVFLSIFCLTLPQNWKFVRIPAFVRRPCPENPTNFTLS